MEQRHEVSPPASPDVVKQNDVLSPIGLPLDGTNSDLEGEEIIDKIPIMGQDDTARNESGLPITPRLESSPPSQQQQQQQPPPGEDNLQTSRNRNNSDVVTFLPDESSLSSSSPPRAILVASMEERIQELETKLAVLSRLLQSYNLQPRKNHGGTAKRPGTPPVPSPPMDNEARTNGHALSTPELPPRPEATPSRDDDDDDDEDHHDARWRRYRSESVSTASTPHLESPLPLSKEGRKSYLERALPDDETDQTNDRSRKQGQEENSHRHQVVLSSSSSSPSSKNQPIKTTTPSSNLGPTLSAFMASSQQQQQQQPATLTLQGRQRGISMDETVAFDNRTSIESSATKATAAAQSKEATDTARTSTTATTAADKTTSAVETPPQKTHSRRNLSFRLLYASDEDDEEEYLRRNGPSAPATTSTNSLSLSERLWLGGSIKLFQKQQQQEDAAEISKARRRGRNVGSSDGGTGSGLASIPRFRIESPPDEKVRMKWLDYLNSFQESTPDVDVQMEEFIKVPAGVEYVMSFGFFICVDSFLYMITVLPIRFVWSCFLLLLRLVFWWNPKWNASPQFRFHRQHVYQLIQVTILYTIYRYVLWENSIGKLYHWIRGQAMLRLYVLIAIVEVFDRLFSSLGQDCLDSMYWNTVSRPQSRRMLISVLVVMIYAAIHSVLLFVHVVTLHVAMNSTDQVLLTLLISGNFAEIKSTVFKKYNKAALFKITASDICERFKLFLFLSLVLLLNFCQGMNQGQFMGYIRICGIVCGAEVIADWIKHAFITKFNFLPARVYREYSLLLAGDVTGIGHEGVNLDNSHAVVKRIGFAQIPLVCVLFRLVREAAKYAVVTLPDSVLQLRPWVATLLLVGVWLGLLMVKLFLGGLLQRISLGKLLAAPEYSQQTPLSKKKKLA